MKPSLLFPVGSLCLVVSILAGAAPSRAQGVCYMTDASGQVINLDALCQGSSEPERPSSQSRTPTAATSEADASETNREDSSPQVTRFTIIRPVVTGGASESGTVTAVPAEPPTPTPGSETVTAVPLETATPTAAPDGRTTRVQVLETQDATITVVDQPDREINGIVIEGRDQLIIGPGTSEPPHDDAAQPGTEGTGETGGLEEAGEE